MESSSSAADPKLSLRDFETTQGPVSLEGVKVLVVHNDVSDSKELSERGVLDEVSCLTAALSEIGVPYAIVAVKNQHNLGQIMSSPEASKCQVVWNLYESPASDYDPHSMLGEVVPLASEIFGKGCTGASTESLKLTLDKARTKYLLKSWGVPVSRDVQVSERTTFEEFARAMEREFGGARASALIVKPTCADASEGIVWNKSVFPKGAPVQDVWRRVDEVRSEMKMPVLVEEMVGTGELNLSLVQEEGGPPRILCMAEIDLSAMRAKNLPPIVDWEAKWAVDSFYYNNTPRRIPAVISQACAEAATKAAVDSWEAVGCQDFGRVDLRFEGDRVWVLEINTNPDIAPDGGFHAAVCHCGLGFSSFVRLMVSNAYKRYLRFSSGQKK